MARSPLADHEQQHHNNSDTHIDTITPTHHTTIKQLSSQHDSQSDSDMTSPQKNNNNTTKDNMTMDIGYTYTAPFDEPLFRQVSITNLSKLDSSFYAQVLHKQLSAMDPSIFFANDGNNNNNGGNNTLAPALFPSSSTATSTATQRYYDHEPERNRMDDDDYLQLPIRDSTAAAAVSRHQLQHAVHEHQQQRRYDSTDGTSIVTTDTDNDMTNSPSSSIPALSPMYQSPHSAVHHAASPFKHSAADVLTSEFALPPPQHQYKYESVGKLSRYITADDTPSSSSSAIQVLPQYYQQNTILNHMSPGQRAIPIGPSHHHYVHNSNNTTTLPQSATHLANIIRHNQSPQHTSPHRSPQGIKHEPRDSLSLPPAATVVMKSHASGSLSSSVVHPDDLPLRYHQHLNVPAGIDQRLSSSTSTQASHVSSSIHGGHHLPTYRAGTKTNNANTMVLGPDGQLKQRRSRDGFHSSASTYNSPTLSAVSVGSSNSTGSVGSSRRYSRPPSTHHTKGHLTTDMSHKYYYDEHDIEHSIRILTVTNHETHAVESFVHAADLGGVVERKSNISRLFGQFNSPAEKVLMNVTGTHNHSIGQESNVLTRAGVLRFFDCSKMRGQTQYREWIEDVILPIFEQNKSATVIENIDEVTKALATQGSGQASSGDAQSQSVSTATTPTSTSSTTRASHKRNNSSSTAPVRRSSRNQSKRRKSRRLSLKEDDTDDESYNSSGDDSQDDDEYDDETYRGR